MIKCMVNTLVDVERYVTHMQHMHQLPESRMADAYLRGADILLSVTPKREISLLRASTVLACCCERLSLFSLLCSPLENLSQSDSSSESVSEPKSDSRDSCRGSKTSFGLYCTAGHCDESHHTVRGLHEVVHSWRKHCSLLLL